MAAQDIVDQIDAIIEAKVNGTFDSLADRRIGDLSITNSTTLNTLMALRQRYQLIANAEDPYFGNQWILYR